jgi:uncharacterized protein
MKWFLRIVGVLLLLIVAAGAWLWIAKPWIPKLVVSDPAPVGQRVTDNGLLANYYPAKSRAPGILVLGGSEGGLGVEMTAVARGLHEQGYSVLHQSYWRAPGQKDKLEGIALETFDAALDWLKARPEVDPERIAVVGWSRGSEAAQLIALAHPEIRAIVLGMPSNAVWAGFDWNDMFASLPSAWTRGDKGLPYLTVDEIGMTMDFYAPDWIAKLKSVQTARSEVLLPIETIKAQVLMICAEKDSVWPSCPMSRLAEERAKAGGKTDVRLVAYADAGHFSFGAPCPPGEQRCAWLSALGGSNEGNLQALKDGWVEMKTFLAGALAEPEPAAAP